MTGLVLPAKPSRALPPASSGARAWGAQLLTQPGLVFSMLVFALLLAWAAVPGVFATHDPVQDLDPAALLAPPSAEHWFGTDQLGRDVYSRVVHGARLSLSAGLLAVAISLVVGSTLGMVSGYVGGWVDSILMRAVDVLVAIPGLLLSMAAVSILGFGVVNVAVAVGIAGVPAFARITRAETLRILSRGYFDAARTSGTGGLAILVQHVAPNASGAVLVLTALELGGAVLSVAALSFLGFGAVPPTPEWGSMVASGRAHIASAWWLTTFPGIVIAATVLASNRISRVLRMRQR
ncbi:ABC transporter permease [Bogoriella caseilytica]|uniref:Peptide/nickel transport system permease protein n=1 Tax=Bogoriella caseilytica TaxID=56055 RepID=A0A3N2BBT1_9MICO|nr:ABC transporter permease [Bogoriella caseilytica]ROR72700.1 peptide/nickel transport system permease protein [Bogoriella caseilytica]